jgi:hypothetical protein
MAREWLHDSEGFLKSQISQKRTIHSFDGKKLTDQPEKRVIARAGPAALGFSISSFPPALTFRNNFKK